MSNTRERWRPDRRRSKGQRMPGNSGSRLAASLKATNVRVQALSVSQIKLNRHNSRTHSAKQIRQIANSIRGVWLHQPIVGG